MNESNVTNEDRDVEEPAGGVELFRMLRSIAEGYRSRAVAARDYDAGAVAMALEALVLAAARSGLHVHMTVSQTTMGG